jgi:hypothetical protein
VKEAIVNMFQDFYKGELDLWRLNFSLLTLIPKEIGARSMKKFRPISLCNYSFKMFLKILTIRLGEIANKLISPLQRAFIGGRYILESVVVAREVVHTMHKNKKPGIILKLDYEKSYDRVDLDFLFEIIKTRGLNSRWVDWIEKVVKGGSVGVTLNGNDSSFFKTGKGLRQGDPLSPTLYNLEEDVLTRMLGKASDNHLIKGLASSNRIEVISLQYADDTILFSDVDNTHLKNLKSTLAIFEQISGMRMNLHKSELIPLNLDQDQIHEVVHLFSFPIGSFPIKYLCVPLHHEKLKERRHTTSSR